MLYLLQHFSPAKWLAERLGLQELYYCDLCLGVWVYWFLAFFLAERWIAVPVLGELIAGATASFVMHLIGVGWHSKFDVYIVED